MKKVILVLAAVAAVFSVKAQEVDFTVGADVVSSYVWRGSALSPGINVQPAATLSVGDFSLGAWGSGDVFGLYKEVDLTAAYTVAGLGISITDYWIAGNESYLQYASHTGSHVFELGLAYTLPESFPLSISWNTVFSGQDYKFTDAGEVKRAYSSYLELGYPVKVKDVELGFSVGVVPFENAQGYTVATDGLAVVNVGVKASKTIKITDSFSVPAFGQLIVNPEAQDIFFVFGVSF